MGSVNPSSRRRVAQLALIKRGSVGDVISYRYSFRTDGGLWLYAQVSGSALESNLFLIRE